MRIKEIDFLRFLGLSLIILAHVRSTLLISQLRNFDVPLMVLISGISFSLTPLKTNYWNYFIKRIKRLAVPVWIFLSFYYLILYIFKLEPDLLTAFNVFGSYAFVWGIGYLWIIRVFLEVALVAPFFNKINPRIKSNNYFLLILLLGLIFNDALINIHWVQILGKPIAKLFSIIVLNGIGFILIFWLGTRLNSFTAKQKIILGISALVIFVAYACYLYTNKGTFIHTQNYKYPASIYYISYGIFASLIAYTCSPYIVKLLSNTPSIEKIWIFVAQNTLWIYLYHIVYMTFFPINNISYIVIRFLIIFTLSAGTYFIHYLFITKLLIPQFASEKTKKNLMTFLVG